MAEMLAQSEKSFSQMVAETPTYISTPTLQAECGDTVKYSIVTELVENFKGEGYNVFTFDDSRMGGRVEFDDGWGLVRASSNLPVLVMRYEARSQERLDELIQLFKDKLKKYPQVSKEWETG
jgi:phosphomannomutase/phosphoglucomutase